MEPNIYLTDILTQPDALQQALSRFNPQPLSALQDALRKGDFDRVILTGMGASLFAVYPAWLALAQHGVPAIWVETGELVHSARQSVTSRSLVWVISQSGRSAEIVALLDGLREVQPGGLLATVNDLDSPLAQAAGQAGALSAALPIDAAPETSVSTRTYLNSLALTQLAARYLCGEPLVEHQADLYLTAQGMQAYRGGWETRLAEVAQAVGVPQHLVLLGRGSSLATAACGALILGEAAKAPAFYMSAGEFRHGPLELCSPELTALLFAGPPETLSLNRKLFADLQNYGARAIWLESEEAGEGLSPSLPVPAWRGIGMPLAEMLPVQMLALHLCQVKGITPGKMRFIGKVTEKE